MGSPWQSKSLTSFSSTAISSSSDVLLVEGVAGGGEDRGFFFFQSKIEQSHTFSFGRHFSAPRTGTGSLIVIKRAFIGRSTNLLSNEIACYAFCWENVRPCKGCPALCFKIARISFKSAGMVSFVRARSRETFFNLWDFFSKCANPAIAPSSCNSACAGWGQNLACDRQL